MNTIPDYVWVAGQPDKNGSTDGCKGCDFRPLASGVKCSDIPCQKYIGLVAKIVQPTPN